MAASLQSDGMVQSMVTQLRHQPAQVDYDAEAGTLVANNGTIKIMALRKGEPGQPWIVRMWDVPLPPTARQAWSPHARIPS